MGINSKETSSIVIMILLSSSKSILNLPNFLLRILYHWLHIVVHLPVRLHLILPILKIILLMVPMK